MHRDGWTLGLWREAWSKLVTVGADKQREKVGNEAASGARSMYVGFGNDDEYQQDGGRY
jgi:hypothetical protein